MLQRTFTNQLAIVCALWVIGIAQVATAQPRRSNDSRFLQDSPRVGETIPDIAAYDENGKKLKLRELKGKHTVIVFGCLT